MKVTTDSAIEPQIVLDTEGQDFQMGEEMAHETWIVHCEGGTADECALEVTQAVMERFVQLDRQEATAYTFGLVRGLLRKSRKPATTPASVEGGAA